MIGVNKLNGSGDREMVLKSSIVKFELQVSSNISTIEDGKTAVMLSKNTRLGERGVGKVRIEIFQQQSDRV